MMWIVLSDEFCYFYGGLQICWNDAFVGPAGTADGSADDSVYTPQIDPIARGICRIQGVQLLEAAQYGRSPTIPVRFGDFFAVLHLISDFVVGFPCLPVIPRGGRDHP
uniref:(northern house mosquito) hypothetical protein n=1 Tax=Culex pipiens TaxID=7175 RepID=A0A8D8FSI5_CULPI